MFKFFGFLLLLALFGFLVLGVLLGRVVRFLGTVDKNRPGNKRSGSKKQKTESSNASRKKFSENEGQYVAYEEVKEDE
ncbi:MAG: DUF4834 domain-containing protein [Prevotella sp.]|jgi:hypothetical protein|nr:DUF4834 domain-containing protein [Prevotella sp.]